MIRWLVELYVLVARLLVRLWPHTWGARARTALEVRHVTRKEASKLPSDGAAVSGTDGLVDFALSSVSVDIWPPESQALARKHGYAPVSQQARTLAGGLSEPCHSAVEVPSLSDHVDYGVVEYGRYEDQWLDVDNGHWSRINGKMVFLVLPVRLIAPSGRPDDLHMTGYFMQDFVLLAQDAHLWRLGHPVIPGENPAVLGSVCGLEVIPERTWVVPDTQLGGVRRV